MPNFSSHDAGMPCWLETTVSSRGEREALIDFYSKVFGWTFNVMGAETGFYSIAVLDGESILAIGEQTGGQGNWVTFFATPNIVKSASLVIENGGELILPPMQVMEFGWKALAKDPSGVVHAFWQAIGHQGFGAMNEPNTLGWFDHVSENPEGNSHYYRNVLANGVDVLTEGDMRVLRKGETWFASMSYGDISEQTPQWMPVVVVDSLDRIKNVVCELGGVIIVEEMEVPGSSIAIFRDPIVGTSLTIMAARND